MRCWEKGPEDILLDPELGRALRRWPEVPRACSALLVSPGGWGPGAGAQTVRLGPRAAEGGGGRWPPRWGTHAVLSPLPVQPQYGRRRHGAGAGPGSAVQRESARPCGLRGRERLGRGTPAGRRGVLHCTPEKPGGNAPASGVAAGPAGSQDQVLEGPAPSGAGAHKAGRAGSPRAAGPAGCSEMLGPEGPVPAALSESPRGPRRYPRP